MLSDIAADAVLPAFDAAAPTSSNDDAASDVDLEMSFAAFCAESPTPLMLDWALASIRAKLFSKVAAIRSRA